MASGLGQAEVSTRTRRFSGTPGKVLVFTEAAFALFALGYIVGAFHRFGLYIYSTTYLSICLGFILAITFVLFPATKSAPTNRLPWYDAVLVILAIAPNAYLAINAVNIIRLAAPPSVLEQTLGLIVVVLVFEAARRTIGLVLSIIGIFFFSYPMYSELLPGLLNSPNYSFQRVIEVIYLYPQGIYGPILHLLMVVIIAFIIFGAFLSVSDAGKFFIDLALGMVGKYRGGPAKVAVLASSFFGMMSGSAIANCAAIGLITIPMMKNVGYKPAFAGAVEATASNGGQLMPPIMGAVAFLMADFLGTTYLVVMIAAILPSILYYTATLVMVDLEAAKTNLRGLPPEQIPPVRQTIRWGWPYLVPFAVLLWFLAVVRYSAETSVIYALIAMLVIMFINSWTKKSLTKLPQKIVQGLAGGSSGLPEIGAAVAVAGLLTASLATTGLGVRLGSGVVELAGGNMLLLLILTAIVSMIIGMAATTSATYIITAITLAPALVGMGMKPIVAHYFLFYFGMAAMVTPPVCLVAYVAASIAGASFWRTGFEAVRLSIVVYLVPFMIVYSPSLLLMGSPLEIIEGAITALLGVLLLSGGLQGYALGRAGWLTRILLLVGGFLLFVPNYYADLFGFIIGAVAVTWQLQARRAGRLAAT